MLERRCNEITTEELCTAIKKGKLKKVKRLVESGNVVIDMFAYEEAVKYQRLKILKYFLKKDPRHSPYALDKAVAEENEEFIKIIITFWKNNKQLCKFDLDSAILSAIYEVFSKERVVVPQVSLVEVEGKMLNKIKIILDTYYR